MIARIDRGSFLQLFALAAAICCFQSCKTSHSAATEKAFVTQIQYDRAFEIIKGIDYLPFGFALDGCYARALIESMELAAEGIPSSSIYAIAKPGTKIRFNSDVEWDYHVAPMIILQGQTTQTVLDPATNQEPIPREKWVVSIHGEDALIYAVPGSFYGYGDRVLSDQIIQRFEDLPAFAMEDIERACQVAHEYLENDPNVRFNQVKTKQVKLVSRIQSLVTALKRLGKVKGEPKTGTLDCTSMPAFN